MLISSTKNELSDILADCQNTREEILQLHQIVAGDSTIARYTYTASDELRQAKIWRRASITFTISTVAWLAYVILYSKMLGDGSLDWTAYPVIFSLTGVLLFGASYGAQQSTRHQNSGRRTRELALKMAAFEPFISSLTDDQKNELRNKVSEQLFNSEKIEEYSGNTSRKVIDHFIGSLAKIQKMYKQ